MQFAKQIHYSFTVPGVEVSSRFVCEQDDRLAAWKLAKSTDRNDPKLWGTSLVVMAITVATRSELAWLFVLAGE